MKKLIYLISLLVLASLVLAACGGSPEPTAAPTEAATEAPVVTEPPATEAPATEPPAPAFEAAEGALVAYPVDAAPELDGVADDAAWVEAQEITIPVAGGYNNFSTEATLKAVYNGDTVYFTLSYADPTESWFRSPWQKQEDGSWKIVKDENDKGGDNNTVYEDKFSMIWSINNSIKNFETAGCFTACHAGENSDVKPYGNKYTSAEGELGDIWHWKSVRNDGQIDDQYLDSTRFDAEKAKEAGRKSDEKESGGYADNATEDKTAPAFTSDSVDTTTGAPGYILDSEKVAIDQAGLDALPVGSYLPGILKSPIVGDRGDISAAWKWKDGVWTIEFSRALTTGSETDVQFSDLAGTYYFGLAVFENAQVRHAFQNGVTPFVFMPQE
ncbi:MAG TPA: ethylbenzene dehydrogenase-related protein [Anaerolineales bacterium]|nr:ethylbenzene dehydrogenase-related protein [Anaerolineales bacterium]